MVHLYILDVYIVCEVYTLSVRIVWCIFCVFCLHREFLYAPKALFSMFYPKIEHLFKKRYTVISQICETKFIILPYFLFNLNTLIFYDTLVQLFCEKLPRIRRKKASLFNSKRLWVTCQRVENKGFTNSQTKVYCINKNFVQLKHPYFFMIHWYKLPRISRKIWKRGVLSALKIVGFTNLPNPMAFWSKNWSKFVRGWAVKISFLKHRTWKLSFSKVCM